MGTVFSGSLWGAGPGGSDTPVVPGVFLNKLIYAAFRIAGITDRPGRTASDDQVNADGFPIFQRMISAWNIDGFIIFSKQISEYPLVAGQKIYTIGGPGAGADFDAPRPNFIAAAYLLWPTSPELTTELRVLTDQEWGRIPIKDISGAPPNSIYMDGNYPIANIYVFYQAPAGYTLQLYTWQKLPTFATPTDFVSLPDGYEKAITYNLAKEVAMNFPTQQRMAERSYKEAESSLTAIRGLNAGCPSLRSEAAYLNGRGRAGVGYGWWIAPF